MKDYVQRLIVEFCCGAESLMGKSNFQKGGCKVIRVTIKDDVTTPQSPKVAMEAVKHPNCVLWASMPCT
eukprot:7610570-Heterocapsa_arctica.AAC.1